MNPAEYALSVCLRAGVGWDGKREMTLHELADL